MIPEHNFLFLLDYETTGLDPNKDYPIEIGGLLLNSKLELLDSYESMISWPGLRVRLNHKQEWPEEYATAYKYHKITPQEYLNHFRNCDDVILDLQHIFNQHTHSIPKARVILCSDNIQFEWNFTKRLFKDTSHKWPFHYCGWDTSLLLEMLGVGDPKEKPHRALADAKQLYDALIRSKDLINLHNIRVLSSEA